MKRMIVMSMEHGDSVIEFDETEATAKARAEAKALFERVQREGGLVVNVKEGSDEPAQKITRFEQVGEQAIVIGRIAGG